MGNKVGRRVHDLIRSAGARRGAVLVPLVVMSTAWTSSVAGVGGGTVRASVPSPTPVPLSVPEGPVVLPEVEGAPPASVAEGRVASSRALTVLPAAAQSTDIPATALTAYQRAAAVIVAADETCRLRWPLIAAIGRVESDHGRVGGSSLDAAGVARPEIVGVRLNGLHGTARIDDTDAGELDADERFDRAVGPMQFIPTTWGLVGVDADGDGERNPQDVDDAALASAVYLCTGEVDLSSPVGLRRAVRRYNDSVEYVATVLSVMRSYEQGALPSPSTAAYAQPAEVRAAGANVSAAAEEGSQGLRGPRQQEAGRPGGQPSSPAARPEPEPRPDPVAEQPVAPALVTALSQTRAMLTCTLQELSQLLEPGRFEECVDELTQG